MVVQPPSLFGTLGQDVDPVYRNLRDGTSARLKSARQFSEGLWLRFYPLADLNFVEEFSRNCSNRFWEMYLGCTFIDAGLCPHSSGAGPDLSVSSAENIIRIEAIAPSSGDSSSPDAVPLIQNGIVQRMPVEKVVLRYRAALEEKHRKHVDYLAAGGLTPLDPYVIAVNGSNVRFASCVDDPPVGMRAVFPLGDLTVSFSKDPAVDGESYFAHRPLITKNTGSNVSTSIFRVPGP
jgi:hypothetical protein